MVVGRRTLALEIPARIVVFAGDLEMDDVVTRYRRDFRLRVASKTSEWLLAKVWKLAEGRGVLERLTWGSNRDVN